MKIILKVIAIIVGSVIASGLVGMIIGLIHSMGYIDYQNMITLAVLNGYFFKILGIILSVLTIVKGIKNYIHGEA